MRHWFSHVVTTVAVALAVALPAFAQDPPRGQAKGQAKGQVTVRGKITKMQAPDQFVVRTQDNKDVILIASPQTRFTINGKAGRYADLRVGTEVNAAYVTQGDRYVVETVTVGAADTDAAPADATFVEGTIVRVVGDDQIVLRDRADKEVIVFVNPQTKYLVEDRPARFADFRQGASVRIDYDVRDRRNWARSVRGVRVKVK